MARETSGMYLKPCVTVLMAVHNQGQYIEQALQSVLFQTFNDFEFLIIDDASTEEKAINLLRKLNDPRVRVIWNETNAGLTNSLIAGVNLSKGKYIARIDADDISTERRLEKMVAYMESHPEVGLLGSSCVLVNETNKMIGQIIVPKNDLEIRWESLFTNPFIHSTVMIRRETLVQNNLNYNPFFVTAQDYELWSRLLSVTKAANLPDFLVYLRIHKQSISASKRDQQIENHLKIAQNNFLHQIFEGAFSDFEIPMLICEIAQLEKRISPQLSRCQLASLYLCIWDQFKIHFMNDPNFEKVQSKVLKKATRMALFPLFQKDLGNTIKLISQLDKLWLIHFLMELPEGIAMKLFSFMTANARKSQPGA